MRPDLSALLSARHIHRPTAYLGFPASDATRHTMGQALRGYVAQRLPEEELRRALLLGWTIEVHGAPEEVMLAHHAQLGLAGPLRYIDIPYNRWSRAKCARRPAFFASEADERLFVAVIAGRDYLRHYAALLRHYLHFETSADPEQTLQIIEYPALAQQLTRWTSFDDAIYEGDLVCYGYAAALLAYLQRLYPSALRALSEFESDYYYAARYTFHQTLTLNFFECKHHGWGDISAQSMQRAAELGAAEILYISKGATCEAPPQIYEQIYCPTKYAVLCYDRLLGRTSSMLRNGLVECFPEVKTGLHASVPCVMEEDYTLREALDALGVISLDNEAAQIAWRLEELQRASGREVLFSAVQFPTDYLRRREERDLTVDFDLENNRREHAEARRREIQERIFALLARYFIQKSRP